MDDSTEWMDPTNEKLREFLRSKNRNTNDCKVIHVNYSVPMSDWPLYVGGGNPTPYLSVLQQLQTQLELETHEQLFNYFDVVLVDAPGANPENGYKSRIETMAAAAVLSQNANGVRSCFNMPF